MSNQAVFTAALSATNNNNNNNDSKIHYTTTDNDDSTQHASIIISMKQQLLRQFHNNIHDCNYGTLYTTPQRKTKTDNNTLYVCSDCNRTFTRNSNLTRHKRIHSTDKRFMCNQCNKTFQEKHHLTAHLRTHSGDKPYQCNTCSRLFTDKSNCSRHERMCAKSRGRYNYNSNNNSNINTVNQHKPVSLSDLLTPLTTPLKLTVSNNIVQQTNNINHDNDTINSLLPSQLFTQINQHADTYTDTTSTIESEQQQVTAHHNHIHTKGNAKTNNDSSTTSEAHNSMTSLSLQQQHKTSMLLRLLNQ